MKQKGANSHLIFILSCIFYLLGIGIYNIAGEIGTSIQIFAFIAAFLCCYKKKIPYIIYLSVYIFISGITGVYVAHDAHNNILKKQQYIQNYSQEDIYMYQVQNIHQIGEFEKKYEVELLNTNIHGIITLAYNFDLKKGDIISSTSKIKPIKNFDPNFNYTKYMQSKNIYFTSYPSSIDNIGHNSPHIVIKKLQQVRASLLHNIHVLYPTEEAIFLGGILLGARESLPDRLKENFNNSGLTHFIAVSGFNITILILFIGFLVKYIPKPFDTIIIISSIILFTLLVGTTAPVVRASIMGGLGYMALVFGRQNNVLSTLCLTGVAMATYSPLSLNYDVSLHLSFAAVIGIIYLQKWLHNICKYIPNILEVREAFVLTLAALIATLPIMIINFGQFSILAIFSNILVTWTIPIAMLGGFLSIIVYYFIPVISQIIAYFTWLLLKWDILVVHFFGELSFSVMKIDTGEFKYLALGFYMIVLLFVIIILERKKK